MNNGDAYLYGVDNYDGTNANNTDTLQTTINNKLNSKDNTDIFEIADSNENVIARVDVNGLETTKVVANEIEVDKTIFQNSENCEFADTAGNIVARIGGAGIHTSDVFINDASVKKHIENETIDFELEVEKTAHDEELPDDLKDYGALYIKCKKGVIKEDDIPVFATYKKGIKERENKDGEGKYSGRPTSYKKGWIIPWDKNNIPLKLEYNANKSNGSRYYDYWKLLPNNVDVFRHTQPGRQIYRNSWSELIFDFTHFRNQYILEEYKCQVCETGEIFEDGNYANTICNFINKKCGVAISRNNSIISDFKPWKIIGPKKLIPSGIIREDIKEQNRTATKQFGSRWCENGQNLLEFFHPSDKTVELCYGFVLN
jgi:hypothetical protein